MIEVEKKYDINFMYSDGFFGRSYYVTINDKTISICKNNGDHNEALKETLKKLKELKINYKEQIIFKHDGWV